MGQGPQEYSPIVKRVGTWHELRPQSMHGLFGWTGKNMVGLNIDSSTDECKERLSLPKMVFLERKFPGNL
jgi:hypothetical protein